MPIASGAAGRVDVGVDTSTTWTPDGLKRATKPTSRNCDSYLQQYQEQRKKNKSNSLQSAQEKADLIDLEKDGAKQEKPKENGSSEDVSSGKASSGGRKSLLCVLL